MSILLTDKQSTQQRRLEKLVMTYESNPLSLTWYLISLIQLQNGFSSLQMKKTPIFAPDVPPQ